MKKVTVREFVQNLSDVSLLQMIKDQELFEDQGLMCYNELRKQTETFMYQVGIVDDYSLHLWMNRIMFEVYRKIALRNI